MTPTFKTLNVRPEQPQDEGFLFELYASTRREELDSWGWPPEAQNAFLAMQFRASQSYHTSYPDAEFQIILLDGVAAGRLIVHRTREEVRVVDIALLPQYRGAGAGTAMLQRVFGESIGSRKPLRLLVRKGNRAARLYQRLGFVNTGETDLHIEMEWHGAPAGNGDGKSDSTYRITPEITDQRRNLERFGELVLADQVLHDRLRAATGTEDFISIAVRLGAERGFPFTAAVVEAGLLEQRCALMERWV